MSVVLAAVSAVVAAISFAQSLTLVLRPPFLRRRRSVVLLLVRLLTMDSLQPGSAPNPVLRVAVKLPRTNWSAVILRLPTLATRTSAYLAMVRI